MHAAGPLKASDFFALPNSLSAFRSFFAPDAPPWEWLRQIGPALEVHLYPPKAPRVPAGVHVEGRVHIDPSVALPSHATIIGPVWIGAGSEIRPGAFIRGNVIVGEGCILGTACEFKNWCIASTAR